MLRGCVPFRAYLSNNGDLVGSEQPSNRSVAEAAPGAPIFLVARHGAWLNDCRFGCWWPLLGHPQARQAASGIHPSAGRSQSPCRGLALRALALRDEKIISANRSSRRLSRWNCCGMLPGRRIMMKSLS